jgi:chitinase
MTGGGGSSCTGCVTALADAKKTYPNLKVIASIGGWSLSWIFSKMEDPTMRANFVSSCIAFCKTYGYDGIDIGKIV